IALRRMQLLRAVRSMFSSRWSSSRNSAEAATSSGVSRASSSPRCSWSFLFEDQPTTRTIGGFSVSSGRSTRTSDSLLFRAAHCPALPAWPTSPLRLFTVLLIVSLLRMGRSATPGPRFSTPDSGRLRPLGARSDDLDLGVRGADLEHSSVAPSGPRAGPRRGVAGDVAPSSALDALHDSGGELVGLARGPTDAGERRPELVQQSQARGVDPVRRGVPRVSVPEVQAVAQALSLRTALTQEIGQLPHRGCPRGEH